jgi:hypothetical protein
MCRSFISGSQKIKRTEDYLSADAEPGVTQSSRMIIFSMKTLIEMEEPARQ